MFDISWSEFLLIGVVALVVIGPKELPAVMRALGQWTRKVRSMASEFQNQFQEAMREAEMADLKKEVDDLAQDVKNFDPLKDVRDHVESVGEDVKQSLASPEPPAAGAEPAALTETVAEMPPPALEAASTASAETPAPAQPDAPPEQSAHELETVGSGVAEAPPQSTEKAAPTDATERSE
jgi:sec-independent protein translocase protein TatB